METDRELALLPPGVRVYLPRASRTKRGIVNDLFEEASGWNFQELDLPTLDYYQSITRGVSEALARRTYHFQDDQGEHLALRPDATAQVAKILSGRFAPDQLPGKYCYSCRNFRGFELRRGELREFQQFGAEILRRRRKQADLELLLFMLEQLEQFGLEEVVVDLGHVQVYKGLIDDVDLSRRESRELRKRIHRKNTHGLEELLEDLNMPDPRKDLLLALPELYGNEEIFRKIDGFNAVTDQTRRGLEYLHDVYNTVTGAGYSDWVSLDLSVVRDLDYYTGIVFEALLSGLGKPIVGGGRYDGLYGTYGTPMPATGFALEIDRILPVLQVDPELPPLREVWCPSPTPESRRVLRELRETYRLNLVFDRPDDDVEGLIVEPDGTVEERG